MTHIAPPLTGDDLPDFAKWLLLSTATRDREKPAVPAMAGPFMHYTIPRERRRGKRTRADDVVPHTDAKPSVAGLIGALPLRGSDEPLRRYLAITARRLHDDRDVLSAAAEVAGLLGRACGDSVPSIRASYYAEKKRLGIPADASPDHLLAPFVAQFRAWRESLFNNPDDTVAPMLDSFRKEHGQRVSDALSQLASEIRSSDVHKQAHLDYLRFDLSVQLSRYRSAGLAEMGWEFRLGALERVAYCHSKLGEHRAAHKVLRRALRIARRATPRKSRSDAINQLQRRLAEVEPPGAE